MGIIIISGWVSVNPDNRAQALEDAKQYMEKTRAREGCLDYTWTADMLIPDRIYVYERWASEEALKGHFASDPFVDMRTAIAAHGITGLDVQKHRVDLSEGVYDPSGTPRADFYSEGD